MAQDDQLNANDVDPEVEIASQRKITAWIESALGGTVTAIDRQDRWRPAWFADVIIDGEQKKLYIRGERNFFQPWPLETEMAVIKILYDENVPVPKIYGMCPDPHAIVMESVEGTRDLSEYDQAQKDEIGREYIRHLARIHAINPQKFADAGLKFPTTSAEIATAWFGPMTAQFEHVTPDALTTFFIRWVRGHIPQSLDRVALVTGDPGQFLAKDGRITALIDFEVAHLGYPASDLGGLRIRNIEEELADPVMLMRYYASLGTIDLDPDLLNFFQVILSGTTHPSIHKFLHEPRADHVNWLCWQIKAGSFMTGFMADIEKIDLVPLTAPEPGHSTTQVAFDSLYQAVQALPATGGLAEYNKTNALGLIKHLSAVSNLGQLLMQEELDDLEQLLGERPADMRDAEIKLEKFVEDGGPDRDLIPFFHRRIQRRRLTLMDTDPRLWRYDLPPLSSVL